MFPKPKVYITKEMLSSLIRDWDLLSYYFGITKTGVTNSPFREDRHPSFSITDRYGKITYKDFSTGEHGDILDMICKKFNLSIKEVINKIAEDFKLRPNDYALRQYTNYAKKESKSVHIAVRTRKWETSDKLYWLTYGVELEFIKKFDIYPIDYFWVNDCLYHADKYSYAYVERLNENVYFKIYQPFSETAKWLNNYPKDTMSLANEVDKMSKDIIICSSVKDALCLWCNLDINCISPQGEGYDIPMEELCNRFPNAKFRILYDNDEAGIRYSTKLSEKYGIDNIVIPQFAGGKDISDYYKVNGLTSFINLFKQLTKWRE